MVWADLLKINNGVFTLNSTEIQMGNETDGRTKTSATHLVQKKKTDVEI